MQPSLDLPSSATSPTLFHDYAWHKSPEDPRVTTRRGFGMEVLCDLMPRIDRFKCQGNGVLGYKVEFADGIKLNPSQFRELLLSAWKLTRLQIPNVAVQHTRDKDGWVQLYYRSLSSHEELTKWAESTLFFTPGSIYDIRNTAGGIIFPDEDSYQAHMHVSPDEDMGGFGLVLQGYHTSVDMIGGYLWMNCLIAQTALLLDRGNFDIRDVKLGQEAENLMPPPDHNLLSRDQFVEGTQLEERLLSHTRAINKIPRDPGLKPENLPSYRTLKHQMSQAETTSLLRAAKLAGYTVSQLLHSAAILTILSRHPPQPSESADATLNYTMPLNLRARLRAPYNRPFAYPGMAVLSSPLSVPINLYHKINWDNITHRDLMIVAEALKPGYARTQGAKMSDGLDAFANALERLIREQGINKSDYQVRIYDPKKDEPPSKILANRIQAISPDGIGENLVIPLHRGPITGRAFCSISDFYCAISHSETVPGFRIHSWGGALHLTLNYNDRVFDNDAMQSYLDQWAEYTRTLLKIYNDPAFVHEARL